MRELNNLYKKLLNESRRIYKRLPNISVYKELLPYKDKDNYFISFTDVEKIGIYPQSQFRTPMGIYAYPLKEAWNKYDVDEKKEVGKSVPFAGDRPHVWLLKLKDGIKFVDSSEDYSSSDFANDKLYLKKYILGNKERYYKSFNLNDPINLTPKKIDEKFNFWSITAKLDSDVSKLWNITRNLAFRGRDVGDCSNKERTSIITNWNTLFYKVLGYYGFADKTGTGYIHAFEPVQAVFFTKSAFDVVSLTPNKEPNEIESSWFISGVSKKEIKVKRSKTRNKPGSESFLWLDGEWLNGTWKNGTWENGTWHNGTWENGDWGNGIWINGIHKKGVWKKGDWLDGEWLNGVWYNGIWENGTWHNGSWVRGEWKGGVWKKGLIYDASRTGNFQPDWKWNDDFVESPISPAEYWKGTNGK